MSTPQEYTVEYAKSARSSCGKCSQKIPKDAVRIGKMVQSTSFDGLIPIWHHLNCIIDTMKVQSLTQLKGLTNIRPDDAKKIESVIVKEDFSHVEADQNNNDDKDDDQNKAIKKRRVEIQAQGKPVDEIIQKEIAMLWKVKDALVKGLGIPALKMLCEKAKMPTTGNQDAWVARFIERCVYGKSMPCPSCGNNDSINYYETQAQYVCSGNVDAWSKCSFRAEEVSHTFDQGFLSSVICVLPSDIQEILKSNRQRPHEAWVRSRDFVSEQQSLAESSKTININVVNGDGGGDNISKDEPVEEAKLKTKRKMIIKDGAEMDESTGLTSTTHVHYMFNDANRKYLTTLSMSDVTSGHNSYYKMQLLKDDNGPNYHLWRAWGRINTDIGGTTIKTYKDESKAIKEFETIYLDKTGNSWSNHYSGTFRKIAGKFAKIDVDYKDVKEDLTGDDSVLGALDSSSVGTTKSKIHPSVQKLLAHWFDVKQIKASLQELEIDTSKMPLGKLSRPNLQKGFDLLKSIERLIDNPQSTNDNMFVSLSNQFYTLIPHTFEAGKPIPVIKSKEQVKEKTLLIQTLLDMEVTSKILQSSLSSDKNGGNEEDNDPFMFRYKQLNTDIHPLDSESETYKMIQTYVDNTHPNNNNSYGYGPKLHLENVYEMSLQGEEENYKPFSNDPNRQLLFHATRYTNVVSILSSGGLKIAPKNAPVSGYRCGKGIYCTGTLSKSATYCFPSKSSNIGYVFLAEVALGKAREILQDEYREVAPDGHGSIHALGNRTTDPSQTITLASGVKVPLGTLIQRPGIANSSYFTDDEMVVYSTNQVVIRYMLRVRFDF